MDKNANILLVHGAWADGSCWSKVLLNLKRQGYNAIAAQIPLTSLENDIAVTRRLLDAQKESTILVGHSYGGAVITGAATGMSQVKALVYITAFGLDKGESLASLSKQGPPSPGSAAIEADDKGYLWINREKFHRSFAADVTDDEAYLMAAVQKPLNLASFGGEEAVPAWKSIPSWYLGLHRRSDDSSSGTGTHGEKDECHGAVRILESRSLHVEAERGVGHYCSRSRLGCRNRRDGGQINRGLLRRQKLVRGMLRTKIGGSRSSGCPLKTEQRGPNREAAAACSV